MFRGLFANDHKLIKYSIELFSIDRLPLSVKLTLFAKNSLLPSAWMFLNIL